MEAHHHQGAAHPDRWYSLARAPHDAWAALADSQLGYIFLAGGEISSQERVEEIARAVKAVMAANESDAGNGEPPLSGATSVGRDSLGAGCPPSVERAIALFKHMHNYWRQSPESCAGVSAVVAVVAGSHVFLVCAGRGVRLQRMTADVELHDLVPAADASADALGDQAVVRIDVSSASLEAGDLLLATPSSMTSADEQQLLDIILDWRLRPDDDAALEGRALPPGIASLAEALDSKGHSLGSDLPGDDDTQPASDGGQPEAWSELVSEARFAVTDIALTDSEELEIEGPQTADLPPVQTEPTADGEASATRLDGADAPAEPPELTLIDPAPAAADEPGLPTSLPGLDEFAGEGEVEFDVLHEGELPPPVAEGSDGDMDPSVSFGDPGDEGPCLPSTTPDAAAPAADDAERSTGSAQFEEWMGDDSIPMRVAFDDDEAATFGLDSLTGQAENEAAPPPLPGEAEAGSVDEPADPLSNWFQPKPSEGAAPAPAPPPLPETDPFGNLQAAPEVPDNQSVDNDLGAPDPAMVEPAGGRSGGQGAADQPPAAESVEPIGASGFGQDAAMAAARSVVHRRRGGTSHSWVMGRRRGRSSLRPALMAMGIASALIGALTVLGFTGGFDPIVARLSRLSPPSLGIGGGSMDILSSPVSYRISSLPPGAEIWIDGRFIGRKTPVASHLMTPGTREVELRLGSFGSWATTVTVEPGSSSGNTIFASLTGRVAARTAKLAPDITVLLDGRRVGEAPVVLDSVSAGRHVVTFRGLDSYVWEEEVYVRVDETSEVIANLDGVESLALVTVRSAQATSAALDYVDGDEVWVDGEKRGTTPADVYLSAGRHAIEIRRETKLLRRVVEIRAGDRLFIDLRMDRLPGVRVRHEAPVSLSTSGSPVIQIAVLGQSADHNRKAKIHLEIAGEWQTLSLGPVPGAPDSYVVGLPVTSAHSGETLRYYFTAPDPVGELYYSPIYSTPLQ